MNAFSQNVDYEIEVSVGDTIVINLGDYVGDNQWQESVDFINWQNTENYSSSIKIVPEISNFYRSVTTVNGCDPYVSETLFVNIKEKFFTDISQDFNSIIDGENFNFKYWKNISEVGNRSWIGKVYEEDKYVQMSAYNSDDDSNTAWLISPIIDFDVNSNEILTFKSAQAYWTHRGLSVWLISDLKGEVIANATKTEIVVNNLASEYTSEHEWLTSETVNLSLFTGKGRIGFKYEGSLINGQTGTFRIDDVEVYNSVTDIDGNIYRTVLIGDQIWMAENLKTTHYANGVEIYLAENQAVWKELSDTDKAYCYYNNSGDNAENYGALYTSAAAMNDIEVSSGTDPIVQGVCPDGWHLPSKSEWEKLVNYLGGENVAGGKLKEEGNEHWSSTSIDVTNEGGFTALPGGSRNCSFGCCGLGDNTYFWSSTMGWRAGWSISLVSSNNFVGFHELFTNRGGFSVRCVKD